MYFKNIVSVAALTAAAITLSGCGGEKVPDTTRYCARVVSMWYAGNGNQLTVTQMSSAPVSEHVMGIHLDYDVERGAGQSLGHHVAMCEVVYCFPQTDLNIEHIQVDQGPLLANQNIQDKLLLVKPYMPTLVLVKFKVPGFEQD